MVFPGVVHTKFLNRDDERGEMMTIERPGFSRRKLLSTAAVGVPAMGALGAVNLFGAPAAKAARLRIDGVWGTGTSLALEEFPAKIGRASCGERV